MNEKSAVLTVKHGIYGGDLIYLSVGIFTGKDHNKSIDKSYLETFKSGDFVKDWYDAIVYITKNMSDYHILYSTGIDEYVKEANLYSSAYLKKVDDVWTLIYSPKPNDLLECYEFFILKDTTPTWVEFKEYCNNNN